MENDDVRLGGGWMPHDGGEMPLPPGQWMEAQYRGAPDPSKGMLRRFGFAAQFAWYHDGRESDIIGYRTALPTGASQ